MAMVYQNMKHIYIGRKLVIKIPQEDQLFKMLQEGIQMLQYLSKFERDIFIDNFVPYALAQDSDNLNEYKMHY